MSHMYVIWALGFLCLFARALVTRPLSLCGFPPFYHESTAALYKQIKKVTALTTRGLLQACAESKSGAMHVQCALY